MAAKSISYDDDVNAHWKKKILIKVLKVNVFVR